MSKPFVNQTRAVRKAVTYKFHRDVLKGQLFSTIDDGEEFHWIDIEFVSKIDPKGTFYNCALETTRYAFEEKCRDLAFDNAERVHPVEFSWVDPSKGNDNKPLWNGLTYFEFCNQETTRLMDSGEVFVRPEIRKKRNYKWGVGLIGVIDEPILNVGTIIEFIHHFWGMGEPDFFQGCPVTFKSSDIQQGLKANKIKDSF